MCAAYSTAQKILTRTELQRLIMTWRLKNSRIVFTNGCFDILHLGHVDYLEKARVLGDHLIVGVNSDDSVRRLGKGGKESQQDAQLSSGSQEGTPSTLHAPLSTPHPLVGGKSERPVQSEESRARIVAALEFVDAVCIFNEDTPLDLILALRPDVLVKGDDYTVDQIVGAKEVIGWGGTVQTIPLVQGHSTTLIVNKIKQSHG